ncbi:hypothetical protein K1719_040514 [Acacia pycnantha]|nr:hypothetical protein K1719_040514 [Acacia pycnantha]
MDACFGWRPQDLRNHRRSGGHQRAGDHRRARGHRRKRCPDKNSHRQRRGRTTATPRNQGNTGARKTLRTETRGEPALEKKEGCPSISLFRPKTRLHLLIEVRSALLLWLWSERRLAVGGKDAAGEEERCWKRVTREDSHGLSASCFLIQSD